METSLVVQHVGDAEFQVTIARSLVELIEKHHLPGARGSVVKLKPAGDSAMKKLVDKLIGYLPPGRLCGSAICIRQSPICLVL